MDSCYFSDPESEFIKMHELIENETYIADLNWHRLSAWQELIAASFDPPERRAALWEVDTITIDYEKGNTAQALMFLGWVASRLNWEPVSYIELDSDYDIAHIKLTGGNDQEILAQLGAIPTADFGEIPGDLVGLRLGSSNPDADITTWTGNTNRNRANENLWDDWYYFAGLTLSYKIYTKPKVCQY